MTTFTLTSGYFSMYFLASDCAVASSSGLKLSQYTLPLRAPSDAALEPEPLLQAARPATVAALATPARKDLRVIAFINKNLFSLL